MYATRSRDELLEIPGRDRARIHRAVVQRLRVGQDDDHLLRAPGEGAFDGLRHVYFAGPLLGADGVTVQGVQYRVAPRLLPGVARRQKHQHVAGDRIPLQVAFQGGPADLNALHHHGLRAGHRRGRFGLNLCPNQSAKSGCY